MGSISDKKIITYPQNQYSNNVEIYKSNRLIESSYQLSVQKNRLIFLAMRKLKKIILDKNTNIEQVEESIKTAKFEPMFIDVVDYKRAFGLKTNKVYQDLESIANDLYDDEIWYINEKNDNLTRKRWVITIEYDKDKKGVKLQFHPDLIRDLLVFKGQYTKLFSEDFADKLRCKYSFRIYELCKQYLILGHRDFYLEELKFKLRIFDDKYNVYNNFKNRVINPSLKELNQYSDVRLEFFEIEKDKKTRKVSKIRFNIYPQQQEKEVILGQQSMFDDPELALSIDEDSIISKLDNLVGVKLTAKAANAIFMKALEGIDTHQLKCGILDYIKEKKDVCDNYIKYKKDNKDEINYIGLLISALSNNYQATSKQVPKLKFTDYEQRTYDFDVLENKLLGWDQ